MPGASETVLDFRLIPGQDAAALAKRVESIAADLSTDLRKPLTLVLRSGVRTGDNHILPT